MLAHALGAMRAWGWPTALTGAHGRGHGLSLLRGWVPIGSQAMAGVALIAAVGPRRVRWLRQWVPLLMVSGTVTALLVYQYVYTAGLSDDPAPPQLWMWIGLSAAAMVLVAAGWRSASWPWPSAGWVRRTVSGIAALLSLLCVGLMLNTWVGYFPTVPEAWSQLTAGPLPDQTDPATLAALAGTGASMRTGRLVSVSIPATSSHFTHRTEYVYLPPAWFTRQRPHLPVVLMLGGEFNTPGDWIRVGNAVGTVDAYAAAHQGNAPILVFVDTGGTFNNDTECVDGPRGDVATYLTLDVPGYLETTFHTAVSPTRWGLVGWSAGGTCAVDLALTHPERFSGFEDIAGDLGPNAGDKSRTIATLYGGDSRAWARYDPLTVLAVHSRYLDTVGWFINSTDGRKARTGASGKPGFSAAWGFRGGARRGTGGAMFGGTSGYGGRPDGRDTPGAELHAAQQLCAAASQKNVVCTLHTLAGGHSWQFASAAFAQALPWLSSQLGVADSTAAPAGPPRPLATQSIGPVGSIPAPAPRPLRSHDG